jgi:hypothetical protein
VRHRAAGPARHPDRPWAAVGTVLFAAVLTLPAAGPAAPARRLPAGIELTAHSGAGAMFAVGGLTPGHPVSRCVQVRVHDALPGSTVRLSAVLQDGRLAPYLSVTVRTGAPAGGCAGFRAAGMPYRGTLRALAESGPAGGVPVLRLPAAPLDVPFQVTVAVADTNAAQGASADFDLVWSAPQPASAVDATSTGSGPAARAGAPAGLLHRVARALGRFARLVGPPLLRAGSAGLVAVLLVLLFLLVQDRIDRRDPKLALAPVRPPDPLGFAPRDAYP